jgi:hypothetical protein
MAEMLAKELAHWQRELGGEYPDDAARKVARLTFELNAAEEAHRRALAELDALDPAVREDAEREDAERRRRFEEWAAPRWGRGD